MANDASKNKTVHQDHPHDQDHEQDHEQEEVEEELDEQDHHEETDTNIP